MPSFNPDADIISIIAHHLMRNLMPISFKVRKIKPPRILNFCRIFILIFYLYQIQEKLPSPPIDQQFPLTTTHRLWSCQRHKHLHRPFNKNYTRRLPMIKNSSLIGPHQQATPLITTCSHSPSPTIFRRDSMKTNSNILIGVTGNIRLLSIRRQRTK